MGKARGKSSSGKDGKEFLEVSSKLRELFGLKQFELAELLSTTKTTVSVWERIGVTGIPSKATPFVSLIQLVSLVRQSRVSPDFLSFKKLRAYVRVTVRGELPTYYIKYVGKYMDEHFFNSLRVPNILALMFALQFDRYLESLGVETPEKIITGGVLVADTREFFSEDAVMSLFSDDTLSVEDKEESIENKKEAKSKEQEEG